MRIGEVFLLLFAAAALGCSVWASLHQDEIQRADEKHSDRDSSSQGDGQP